MRCTKAKTWLQKKTTKTRGTQLDNGTVRKNQAVQNKKRGHLKRSLPINSDSKTPKPLKKRFGKGKRSRRGEGEKRTGRKRIAAQKNNIRSKTSARPGGVAKKGKKSGKKSRRFQGQETPEGKWRAPSSDRDLIL